MNLLDHKKSKLIITMVLTIMLFIICHYYHNHNSWLSVDTCLENPEKYHSSTVNSFREPVIKAIHADGFILKQKNRKAVKVYADTTDLIPNKYIGLIATFHKDGYLTAQTIKVSENRRYKILLSIIPILLVFFLFTRVFRWDWKTLVWRTRDA